VIRFERAIEIALIDKDISSVSQCVGIVRVNAQGGVEIRERLVEIAFQQIAQPALVQGKGVVDFCCEYLVVVGNSAVIVSFVFEDTAVVGQRVDVVRRKTQGPIEIRERLVEIALVPIGQAALMRQSPSPPSAYGGAPGCKATFCPNRTVPRPRGFSKTI
jgi:hypothetical protein